MEPIKLPCMRSVCPVAAGLDILGDRWTLLIVREMILYERHRYNEFMEMPEGITTSVLAARLKQLEQYGIIEKRLYEAHPPRYAYHLTARGRELEPVMRALIQWSLKHVAGTGR